MEEEDSVNSPVRSFTEALQSKYADYEAKFFENIRLSPRRRAAFIKEQSLLQKQVLALDGCKVGSAGEPGEIAKSCPNVRELDLTKNELSCWKQVFMIACQLPKLTFLNLSSNPLSSSFDKSELKGVLQNNKPPPVQKLVLNNTRLPLETVYEILTLFPKVEELHLSLNVYGTVPEHVQQFKHVKSLHFASNGIKQWICIENIARVFPCLENLIVSENSFEGIKGDSVESVFPKLSKLSVSKTKINNWDSVDYLRKFPALNDIRLIGIPLLKKHGEDERRKLLISRLPNAKKLNGSVISETERENAERMFIRYYMDYQSPPDRYHELVDKHGQLEPLVNIDLTVKQCADLTIHFEDKDSFSMKVDLEQTEKDFKKLLAERLGQEWTNLRMFYQDVGMLEAVGEEEMTKPNKQLYTYRMRDGDGIAVVRRKRPQQLTSRF